MNNKSQEHLKNDYPQLKADIDLCRKHLSDICKGNILPMCVPPYYKDFDMQFSAAFDELKAYRETGKTPEQVAERVKAEQEERLKLLPCKIGDTVYIANFWRKKVDSFIINFVSIDREGRIFCYEHRNTQPVNPIFGVKLYF